MNVHPQVMSYRYHVGGNGGGGGGRKHHP